MASPSAQILAAGYSCIPRGELTVVRNWIPPPLIKALREDAMALHAAGSFSKSGLSNRGAGDSNAFGKQDRLCLTVTPALGGDRSARAALDARLEELRRALQDSLAREHLELAEQYYSVSGPGAFLARHMDERHEDTKGEGGWASDTRRSVSWLLYLSADGWDTPGGAGAGGAFRAFCRTDASGAGCGAHEGNVQVGWLAREERSEAVFLDSWVKTPCLEPEGEGVVQNEPREEGRWQARAALYRVTGRDSAKEGSGDDSSEEVRGGGVRDYLTEAFGADSAGWPAPRDESGYTPEEFAAALRTQLPEELRAHFCGTEEVPHPRQEGRDVAPEGGTLVLFDSATLPHQVLPTERGERIAIAGWFHEPQQPFPEWYT